MPERVDFGGERDDAVADGVDVRTELARSCAMYSVASLSAPAHVHSPCAHRGSFHSASLRCNAPGGGIMNRR
jgi:hypothetical protein